jgi:hypothetical protein
LTEALVTSFVPKSSEKLIDFSRQSAELTVAVLALWWLTEKAMKRSPARPLAGAGAVISILLACLYWSDYVHDYRQSWKEIWPLVYGKEGDLWGFVQKAIPPEAAVAYSNQFMIYPLYCFDLSRRVIYAPVRQGESIATLAMPPRLSGEQIASAASAAANYPVDRTIWMQNLRAAAVQYLVVGASADAPEMALARSDPEHFRVIFQNQAGTIFLLPSSASKKD